MSASSPICQNSLLKASLALGLLGFFLAGCPSRPGKTDPTVHDRFLHGDETIALSLQTDWFPQPENAGFYQALERGFYAEAGLEVEIRPGGPNTFLLQRVASGQADMGVGGSDDVILAIARGLPLVIVATWMQKDPQGIMVHASSPVRSFTDLQGKRIMATPGLNWVEFLRRRYNLQFDVMPMTAGLARFLNDPGFIQQCYVTNEPFFARQAGADVRTLLMADAGYRPFRVLFTNRSFFERASWVVAVFVEASIQGWYDYLFVDPAPAHQSLALLNPQMTDEFMAFCRQAILDMNLVEGDPARGEAAGILVRSRVLEQIDLLVELGLINPGLTPEDVSQPVYPRPADPN